MNRIFVNEEQTVSISNIIYKYFDIDDFLISTLRDDHLWFSNPNTFNDPYDCNLNYDWGEVSFNEIFNKILAIRNRDYPKISMDIVYNRAMEIYENDSQKDGFQGLIQKLVDDQGVCCFSEINDSLLMWSHYSNKHTGVCLSFDILKDSTFFTDHLKLIIHRNTLKLIRLTL